MLRLQLLLVMRPFRRGGRASVGKQTPGLQSVLARGRRVQHRQSSWLHVCIVVGEFRCQDFGDESANDVCAKFGTCSWIVFFGEFRPACTSDPNRRAFACKQRATACAMRWRRKKAEIDGGSNGDGPDAPPEIVSALAKQLKVEEAAVRRIFAAGVDHAERARKRRRLLFESPQASADPGGPDGAAGASPSLPSNHAPENASDFRFHAASVTLEQLRAELAVFAKERDWDQFHSPRNLALAMIGEVGELCECFQWKGEVPEGLPGWSEKQRAHVGQELADVLLYLLRLSHKCHVDLAQAALDKLALNAAKYPAFLVRGSSKKYSEYGTAANPAASATTSSGGACAKPAADTGNGAENSIG